MSKWKPISLLLVILLTIFQVSSVFAYTLQTNPGYAGTNAGASKDSYIVSSTAWNANIRSFTYAPGGPPGSGANIGTIGWVWWTFRETCGSVILSNWPQPSRVIYGGRDIGDTGFDSRRFCSPGQSHLGWSMGKHDFKQTGWPNWNPEFSNTTGL